MSRVAGFVMLTVMLAVPSQPRAENAVSAGDFDFYLDSAGFRKADGSTLEEIYLRVSNAQVRFKQIDGRLQGRARVSIRIRDDNGKTAVKESTRLKMYADNEAQARDPLRFQTLIRKFELAPGRYDISCVVEDLNSPKMTVLGMVRGAVKTSVVESGVLDVPDFSVEGMTLSDAKFMWRMERSQRGGVDHPNPSRLYGLYRDSLQVYFEAYVPADIARGQEALQIETHILNEQGEVVRRASAPLPDAVLDGGPETVRYPIVINEDLNRFPAGRYALYLNAGLKDRLLARVLAGRFSVAWDMKTWEASRQDFVAEAQFLLDEDDFDDFAAKSPGEQEVILQAMWKEADPDVLTGVNEAYQEFQKRLSFVNAKFTDYQLGIFTDRGLIYLKFGPPDEVVMDVMPLNRESVSDALEKVGDKFHVVNFSNSGGRIDYARPSRNIIIDPRRLGSVGEGGDVAFPYELWVYNGGGDPILKRDRSMEPDIGLRFIFVDREGYGRYKLESSSSLTNK
ncbi:MAG: GWxTD domain-containing protein [Candidatus Krumholzibacteriia bacterium]